jgi:hypothetical protein
MGTTIKGTKYCFHFFVKKKLELNQWFTLQVQLGFDSKFSWNLNSKSISRLSIFYISLMPIFLLCSSLFIHVFHLSFFFHLKFCHWFSFLLPQSFYVPLSFYCKLLVHFVASHRFFCAIWKDLCFYKRKFMALFSFAASHLLFFCKLQLFIKRILGWKVWSAIIVLW